MVNPYGWAVRLERSFFLSLPFLRHRSLARVVSIGNLTVGGTGKTPILLDLLADPARPSRTVVLSRGYKSPWERGFYLLRGKGAHPDSLTDEALLVNAAFPEVPLLLGKNRFHSARQAERLFRPELILLDDGFQYRRLERDVDLVLWDALRNPETEGLLPFGRCREPFSRLADAHAILLTRCELVQEKAREVCRKELARLSGGRPVIEMETVPEGWVTPNGSLIGLSSGPSKVFLLCAIGSPASFVAQVEQAGGRVVGKHFFPDHHRFSASDLETVFAEARRLPAAIVCTEKDRVKIPSKVLAAEGVFALRIRMRPRGDGSLREALATSGVRVF